MNAIVIISILVIICCGVSIFFIRRHYEALLKTEIKRAQTSERLKSVFIDNISHSLRSPLKAISGYCNMLLEEKEEKLQPAIVKEMVTNISNNAQQLTEFVSVLLQMSKYEGITPSFTFIEVNLTELMASYRREAMNIAKPDVTVRVNTDLSPHCKAYLDTNFMHQLMMHLLTNAANHVTDGDIIIRYGKERNGLKVSVCYTGVGQSNLLGVDIYSLLQKEEVLRSADHSSILGLATCKAIVEVLGGEFFMDIEYDKKTVASFWFPCKMRDAYKNM